MSRPRFLCLAAFGLLLGLLSFSPWLGAEPPPVASDDPLSWFEKQIPTSFANTSNEVKAQLEVLRQMLLRLRKEGERLRHLLLTARRENEALKQRLADQESRAERMEARLTGTLMRQLLDRVAAVEAENKKRLQTAATAQKKSLATIHFWLGEKERRRNWTQAVMWYQKACAEGHAEACKAKEKPVYVAGQRQAVEYLPQGYAVYIPAGSFVMGSPDDEKQRESDEGPQRRVTLTHSGWMLETEVTQEQFQALMGYNKSQFSSCGERCPVENVSWNEAAAFANALSGKQGKPACFTCEGSEQNVRCSAKDPSGYVACRGWRLPTEAEWEYAARAGTTTRFHTRDCITTGQANFDGNHPPEGCPRGEYRQKTIAVGSLAKNAWGLFDMHGNVWEWVYDFYQGSYTGFAAENPAGPSAASSRIIRGGSWYINGRYLRAAYRDWGSPPYRDQDLGFRLFTRTP